MKLTYYHGANFGDALNQYLLPKVFPNFFDEDESTLLLGIGSILFDNYPANAQKIVFGSGFARYSPAPTIDETWKIYAVRGPRTADALKIDRRLVAADSAVLINKYRPARPPKRHKVSFMPHWGSIKVGRWESVSKDLGINLIDPRWSVERVLEEIESSEAIIAEAMHAAITADALRVPWIALAPVQPGNRFKWYDWAEALEIKLQPRRLAASSLQEALIASLGGPKARWARGGFRILGIEKLVDIPFTNAARATLQVAMNSELTLSADSILDRAIDQLETAALKIQQSFPGINPSMQQRVT